MAKVKSVKFYNFTDLPGNIASGFLAKFYDENNRLILIDLRNCISKSLTYSESSDYVITSDSSNDYYGIHININAFHVGNFNNVLTFYKDINIKYK